MNAWDHFINGLFDWCVRELVHGANFFGISYEEINLWVFCIIEPVVFSVMLYIIILQRRKIKILMLRKT